MQKSKIATICLIIVIAVYTIIRVTLLVKLGDITPYVINPIFWITFAIVLYKLLDKNYAYNYLDLVAVGRSAYKHLELWWCYYCKRIYKV